MRERKGHSLVGISSIGLSRTTLGRIFHNHFWQSFYSLIGWNQAEKESMKNVCMYLISEVLVQASQTKIRIFNNLLSTLLAIHTINIREFQKEDLQARKTPDYNCNPCHLYQWDQQEGSCSKYKIILWEFTRSNRNLFWQIDL